MELEHLTAPENKKVLLNTHTHTDRDMSKGHGNHVKELPVAKAETTRAKCIRLHRV